MTLAASRRAALQDAARFQRRHLDDLRTGRRSWRLGVKLCHCGRTWGCDECGRAHKCWNTWPFLWDLAMRGRGKLCQACYRRRIEAWVERQRRR